MATTSLTAIREYARNVSRNPTENQLSTADLDDAINNAYLYNFTGPKSLITLRKTLTFYTQPNVDTYKTTDIDPLDPLYDFKNRYPVVHRPVYIGGVSVNFTEYRNEFYSAFTQTNYITDTTLRGDGTVGPFSGTLQQKPVLQRNVMFSCLDTSGTAMVVVDFPTDNVQGILAKPNDEANPLGTINYITGAFSFSFPAITQNGAKVESTTIPYSPAIPRAMLFYDTTFTLRPVPDKAYIVTIDVDARPTEILGATSEAELKQWWQYIALLAAELIMTKRGDEEGLARIAPALIKQQDIVGRETLCQYASEKRSQTYFTAWGYNNLGWPYGGPWTW